METCNQDCEVYARVVGYVVAVSSFNDGKIEEWKDRVNWSGEVKE